MRYHTTVMATEMVMKILKRFSTENKKIKGKPQVEIGKYFTAMNLDKKYEALNNFLNYKMDVYNG